MRRIKLYRIRTQITFFFICCGHWGFKNILTGTLQILENVIVETFLFQEYVITFYLLIKNIEIL
jgi:hypothetical protein